MALLGSVDLQLHALSQLPSHAARPPPVRPRYRPFTHCCTLHHSAPAEDQPAPGSPKRRRTDTVLPLYRPCTAEDHASTKFTYKMSPIQIVVTEQPKQLYRFLTAVCAVIGGVFTVAGGGAGRRRLALAQLGRQAGWHGQWAGALLAGWLGLSSRKSLRPSCTPSAIALRLPAYRSLQPCPAPAPAAAAAPLPMAAGILDGMVHQVNKIAKKVDLGKQG